MKKLFTLILCAAMLLSAFSFPAAAASTDYKPIVILKLDDLGGAGGGFQKVFEFIQKENITAGFGVIGKYLEDNGNQQEFYDAIKMYHDAGIEIWHHGYLHELPEYHDSDYNSQYENFKKTVDLLQEKCGITVTSFGSPFNNSDVTTAMMIEERFPQITNIMFNSNFGDFSALRLETRVEIESATGTANYDVFTQSYDQHKHSPYIVLQGHAGQWDEASLAEFKKIVAFLKEKDCTFMTPSEYTQYYREQQAKPADDTPKRINVTLNGKYMDFEDAEPTMINDRVMVPFRAIFEALEADIEWDAETASATASQNGNTVKITENSNIAYLNGEPVELDTAATIIDSRFVVPIRFVSESLDRLVYWDDANSTVVITSRSDKPYTLPDGAAEIKDCTFSSFFEDELGYFSYDGDPDTLWSCEGVKQWVCYDLGQNTSISKVSIMWNKGDQRQASFKLETSDDAKNFTSVFEGTASGTTTDYEDFATEGASGRYLRVYCMGNNISTWNAIREIVIYK